MLDVFPFEVDINEDGTLDQQPDLLQQLDFVVASVHSKLRSDRKTMTERMRALVRVINQVLEDKRSIQRFLTLLLTLCPSR